jgi:hypothetical protein
MKLCVGLGKHQGYRRLKGGIIALGLAILILGLGLVQVAQADANQPEGTTASDLSNIPNLEQMDSDKYEQFFGDMPKDQKPLFNPDNGKSQVIKDKNSTSNQEITPADLKADQTE